MDDSPNIPLKQCFRCKCFYPATLDFFHAKTRNEDHLRESCKKCYGSTKMGIPKPQDGYKRCSICRKDLPQTTDYFFKRNAMPDGLDYICKACDRAKYLEMQEIDKRGLRERPETLTCKRCGTEKPATRLFFKENPMCLYGLDGICKTCKNAKSAELDKRNPEKVLAKRRKYASQKALYEKSRYQRNHEEIRAKANASYALNADAINAYQRKYSKSDRMREMLRVKNHRRRALKRNATGTHTPEDIQRQYKCQKGRCYYCKTKVQWGKHHIEHVIPLAKHGTNDMSNIVISCPTCNLKKGTNLWRLL